MPSRPSSWPRTLFCFSVVVAAALAGMVIGRRATAPQPDAFYRETAAHLRRLDRSVLPGDVLFLGDSHVQGMNVTMVTPHGVNFGIGGETSDGLLRRIESYTSLRRASAVVIAIGFNDLYTGNPADSARTIAKILLNMPVPVVLSAVPPIDAIRRPEFGSQMNDRIAALNVSLMQLCKVNCWYVPASAFATDATGNLRDHEGDGVHLNTEAYTAWTAAIKTALQDIPRRSQQ